MIPYWFACLVGLIYVADRAVFILGYLEYRKVAGLGRHERKKDGWTAAEIDEHKKVVKRLQAEFAAEQKAAPRQDQRFQ